MQIRLTVLATRGGQAAARPRDVVVTAPAGTVLATVAEGLVAAAAGADADGGERGERERGHECSVPVYAGTRRLDPQRQLVGAPPLVDGAEVSLYGPSPVVPVDAYGSARARLHVVAGPDAGGVHLLHGGRVSLGRSADADVPLDDPDVSRLHCAVTVTDSGALTVTDLDSTNGTSVDGVAVRSGHTAALPPGATVRLGESAARVEAAGGTAPPALPTTPDQEGRLRLPAREPAPWAGPAKPSARHPQGSTAYGGAGDPGGPDGPDGPGDRTAPEADTDTAPSAGPATPHAAPAADRQLRRPRAPRGLSSWTRRLASWRTDPAHDTAPGAPVPAADAPDARTAAADDVLRPDLATVLLTALGPGPRLWERGPDHPDALTVRIGRAHRSSGPGEPVLVDLRATGSLGLAGPRPRLGALARSVLAQLAALHGPAALEMVLIATDGSRETAARTEEWSWLGWLPHLRPAHGQDCRLLVAYDPDQAAARTAELSRRLEETLRSRSRRPRSTTAAAATPTAAPTAPTATSEAPYIGPRTLLVVDGDPGSAAVREAVSRLAAEGGAAGVHVLCLAEAPSATPASPLDATLEAAGAACPPFHSCGAFALLSGAVATAVRIARPGRHPAESTVATMDGVSPAWAERFGRALAPLREPEASPGSAAASTVPRAAAALPRTCRLLDELGLARATPAALRSRWAAGDSPHGRARFTLGAGRRGPVTAALTASHGHAFVTGAAGTGKTELLRSLAASLAADAPPDRLALLLVDGDGTAVRDGGLGACTDLPHLHTRLPAAHLVSGDPVRMRDFAQALTGELKRRATLLDGRPFPDASRVVSPRRPQDATAPPPGAESEALPRLVVLVDDFDTLVDPALGDPGRPAAGSVVRALEAVAREGAALGVHLIAASGRADVTADTVAARAAALRVALSGRDGDDTVPGRGTVHLPDGDSAAFQAGRITGRIPRTATLRPTVVRLDWARAGDPPSRRPVRELGNGPTDLALLASAMTRAAHTAPAAAPTTA